MIEKCKIAIAVMGIDIGKNCFHVLASTRAVRSGCGRNGRAGKWKRGSPIWRRASSAWRPALVRII